MSLLVVGSVAFDDVETPFGQREHVLGGSASFFSLSARFFHPIRLVAVVGGDFSAQHKEVFETRKIDLTGLIQQEGLSFHWKGYYGTDLNEAKTLETHLNVFAQFHPELSPAYRASEFLFLGNIHPEVQLDVVRQMDPRPKWIALDTMNFWIQGTPEALKAILREVDILLVNDAEVRQLTGERNLLQAYRMIRELGPQILVVKRGEYGAALFCPEGIFMVPAFPLEQVVDPTGAGDTFAGGFLGHLASEGRMDFQVLKRATLVGSIMASFTVEAFSTEKLEEIDHGKIEERLSVFINMIHCDDFSTSRN